MTARRRLEFYSSLTENFPSISYIDSSQPALMPDNLKRYILESYQTLDYITRGFIVFFLWSLPSSYKQFNPPAKSFLNHNFSSISKFFLKYELQLTTVFQQIISNCRPKSWKSLADTIEIIWTFLFIRIDLAKNLFLQYRWAAIYF